MASFAGERALKGAARRRRAGLLRRPIIAHFTCTSPCWPRPSSTRAGRLCVCGAIIDGARTPNFSNHSFLPPFAQDIIWQILCGVDFLHSHRIVHRDLKPQNLLVTREGNVKLTDFGLARIYEFYTLLTSVVVTLWYRSPEVLMGLPYATPVDIWSCGCIFAELFLRKPLFPGQYELDQLQKIFELVGTPSEEDWPENAAVARSNFRSTPPRQWPNVVPEMDAQAQDLVQRMLSFNPSQRITAHEALLHPYFADAGLSPLSFSPSTASSSSASTSMRSDRSLDSSLGFSSPGAAGGGDTSDTSGASSKT